MFLSTPTDSSSTSSTSKLFFLIALTIPAFTSASSSRAWINWSEDPTEAILTWHVKDESIARNQWVKYGFSSGSLTQETAYATISQYATPPTSKFQSYTSSFIERATLTDLNVRGGRVFYSFGSDLAGWSVEKSFTAHPGVGPNTTISMVILGDTGFIEGDSYGTEVFNRIARPEFVSKINAGGMILGDLTYANGNQTIWDVFQDTFEPVSSTMSFQTNAGLVNIPSSLLSPLMHFFVYFTPIFVHHPHSPLLTFYSLTSLLSSYRVYQFVKTHFIHLSLVLSFHSPLSLPLSFHSPLSPSLLSFTPLSRSPSIHPSLPLSFHSHLSLSLPLSFLSPLSPALLPPSLPFPPPLPLTPPIAITMRNRKQE